MFSLDIANHKMLLTESLPEKIQKEPFLNTF